MAASDEPSPIGSMATTALDLRLLRSAKASPLFVLIVVLREADSGALTSDKLNFVTPM
jgi:hypothetical protein